MNKMNNNLAAKKSFTLIELMVVIAIIGLLSSIVLVNLSGAQEKAKVAKTVETVRQIRMALELYADATGDYPTNNCMPAALSSPSNCTQANDPFLNALGKPGWNGPYLALWNLTHAWKGHIGISRYAGGDDWDGDGIGDCMGIYLDDDRPSSPSTDNGGRIPNSALIKIEEILEGDGLQAGNVRAGIEVPGGSPPYLEAYWRNPPPAGPITVQAVQGEMVIRVGCYKQ